jgi:hypothetical protein
VIIATLSFNRMDVSLLEINLYSINIAL